MNYDLKSVLTNFDVEGSFLDAKPYGNGHINDTFLVRMVGNNAQNYLLQRVNHYVFKNVPQLMMNIERVLNHIQKKLNDSTESDLTKTYLTLIPAKSEKIYYQDAQGNYWRIYRFIEKSKSYDIVNNTQMAYSGGRAFGMFQALVADLPTYHFYETIPNFHNIEKRLETFFHVHKRDPIQRVQEIAEEVKFVETRAEEMTCINRLGREGKIPERITHNDTKFNNVLFDENDQILCVIDLDTVMPGYVHYDFGDAIRTSTNTGAEDEKDLRKVSMDIHLYEAFSKGYLEKTKSFLTMYEVDYLAFSGKLMTFMIGLRFLTDYIDGDKYYKINNKIHNLQRARAQFKLLESMEEQYDEMQNIIYRIYKK